MFIRKFGDAQKAFSGMKSYNSHGSYLAFEEYSGSGQRGLVIVPEGKNNWGWCSFVEVLQFLLSPYSLVKQTPLGVKTDDLPSSKLQDAQGVRTYAQVVR